MKHKQDLWQTNQTYPIPLQISLNTLIATALYLHVHVQRAQLLQLEVDVNISAKNMRVLLNVHIYYVDTIRYHLIPPIQHEHPSLAHMTCATCRDLQSQWKPLF